MVSFLGGTANVRIPGIAVYSRLSKLNLDDEIAKFAKRQTIQKEITYFRSKIADLKSTDDFIKNPRLLNFALSAYGMESQAQYPARIKQVLMSDPADRYSVAQRMADERYRAIAVDFDFFNGGLAKFSNPAFMQFLESGYITAEYERDLGNLNPALSDAMYFRRTIGNLNKTQQLYGDNVLFDVVKEGLSIPNAAVTASVEQLTKRIEAGFDVTKAKDTAYVDKFVQRYLALKDSKAQQASGNLLLGLFA